MGTFSRETFVALDPWYVTGLIDGSGTFTYSRSGRQIMLYFAVKQRASGTDLLTALQSFFGGIGTIYEVPRREGADEPTGRRATYFRVCRLDELERILTHFDRYPLRGGKRESYAVWREMVTLKRSYRRPPREELLALATKLSR